jgi:hypothetical protein
MRSGQEHSNGIAGGRALGKPFVREAPTQSSARIELWVGSNREVHGQRGEPAGYECAAVDHRRS